MGKIVLLPIEPFEERYTSQWFDWFSNSMDELKINNIIINPKQLNSNIQYGQVLDAINTNYYKSMQIAEVMKLIHSQEISDGDTIFLLDGWFPGLESIEYARRITGKDIKIAGMLHAGTWDPADFLNRYSFKKMKFEYCEYTWLNILDRIYVASEWHKKLIIEQLEDLGLTYGEKRSITDKLIIIDFPLSLEKYESNNFKSRENNIVFPHRLDSEKNPDLFDNLENKNTNSTYKFIKTKEQTKNKLEYYELLKDSKVAVSFADQETFGIAMLESCFYGCLPLVPDDLSYSEMYPAIFKYPKHKKNDSDYLLQQIDNLIKNYDNLYKIALKIANKYHKAEKTILMDLILWSNK